MQYSLDTTFKTHIYIEHYFSISICNYSNFPNDSLLIAVVDRGGAHFVVRAPTPFRFIYRITK